MRGNVREKGKGTSKAKQTELDDHDEEGSEHPQNSDDMIPLFCLFIGDPIFKAFKVRFRDGHDIDDLKYLIKEKRNSLLNGIDAADLTIYRAFISDEDEARLQAFYRNPDADDHQISKMKGRAKISSAFTHPENESMYAIVQLPGMLMSAAFVFTFISNRPIFVPSAHLLTVANHWVRMSV
jgi:hypothetical protein